MMYEASEFVFQCGQDIARSRRVLIKPSAGFALPYPVTTSRETLGAIIRGIRRVSEADILLLEGPESGEHVRTIYRMLGYDFPRVLGLDVRDCTLVEVENPLPKPFALPSYFVPNVVLSCDYLISVTPFRVFRDQGWLTIANLLGLLPQAKYGDIIGRQRGGLTRSNLNAVIADLYFTVPFDQGIIDARIKFTCEDDLTEGAVEEFGKIFAGDPLSTDCEAAGRTDVQTPYLHLITSAKAEFEAHSTHK